jgi:hypothetical protein
MVTEHKELDYRRRQRGAKDAVAEEGWAEV